MGEGRLYILGVSERLQQVPRTLEGRDSVSFLCVSLVASQSWYSINTDYRNDWDLNSSLKIKQDLFESEEGFFFMF